MSSKGGNQKQLSIGGWANKPCTHDNKDPYLEDIENDMIVFTFNWNSTRLPKETISKIRDASTFSP